MVRTLKVLLPVVATLASCGVMAPAASAADPGFCHEYAETAVRQFNAAFAVPRCRGGMNGPRWSHEFRVHYDWCLGAAYNAVEAERRDRAQYIYACR